MSEPNLKVEPKRWSWLEQPCYDKLLKFFEVGCSCSGRLLLRLLW